MMANAMSEPSCRPVMDDRHQRVPQRMAEVDAALCQATGSRETAVIGAQHLQHLGTHQPHDQRQLKGGQRECGQDQVQQAVTREQAGRPAAEHGHLAASEAGQPFQLYGEDPDQHDTDDEIGQADTEQGRRHQDLSDRPASPQGRVDTQWNAQAQGQSGRDKGEFQRRRKAFGDQCRDLVRGEAAL